MTREEAIKTIRLTCPKISDSECDFETAMRFLIPELRESEDERIIKLIRSLLENARNVQSNTSLYKQYDDALAWLEKQKDTSKAIEAVEKIDKYIDEHLANAHDMKDSNPDKKYYRGWDDALGKMSGILQDVYSGEKKKESLRDFIDNFPYSDEQEDQKPSINIDQLKSLMLQYLQEAANEKDDSDIEADTDKWARKILEYDFEQKPAEWIKEDEEKLNLVIDYLQFPGPLMKYKLKDWLKSLPERFNLQPKQKWNEEDEAHRNFILESLEDQIRFCKKDAEGAYYVKQIRTAQNWLKSFHPSWKPSEHQMTILKAVKNYVGVGSGYWGEALGSLIEDLEKL